MKTMEQIRKQLDAAWTFGVLGRDFRATCDLATMGDDWQRWLIDELRGDGLNVIEDGDGYLALATAPHTATSGSVPPIGTPIARIAFPAADDLTALYLFYDRPDPVQRSHPWSRLSGVRGHVSLTYLSPESEVLKYGAVLADHCMGRIYKPYQTDTADQPVPVRYPLTDLIKEHGGVSDLITEGGYTLRPPWSISDAAAFFAPIEPQIKALLTDLGIGSTFFARNYPGYGKDYQFHPFFIWPEGPVVDLAGRVIKKPEALLAKASLELWQQRIRAFDISFEIW